MNFITLRISGKDLDPEKITKRLALEPDFSCKKDEVRSYRGEQITYEEGCWSKGEEVSELDNLEQSVQKYLMQYEKCQEQLISISKDHTATLWITLYPEVPQINVHFSQTTLQAISVLGLSLDVSVINLQKLYE